MPAVRADLRAAQSAAFWNSLFRIAYAEMPKLWENQHDETGRQRIRQGRKGGILYECNQLDYSWSCYFDYRRFFFDPQPHGLSMPKLQRDFCTKEEGNAASCFHEAASEMPALWAEEPDGTGRQRIK